MEKEIDAVGGNAGALAGAQSASDILNVRFRVDNVALLPPNVYAQEGDRILGLSRYQLYKVDHEDPTGLGRTRAGSELPPNIRSFIRKSVGAREVSPEHAKMQAKLMQELRHENPTARVVREQEYIDVLVETATSICLYEIKSDLSPATVLRQAIGQLLEYSHRIHNPKQKAVTLVAVGRAALTDGAGEFLQHLQLARGLPLGYRVVEI
jgi:hypothetical protein